MSRRLVLRIMRRMVKVAGMTPWGRPIVRVMSETNGAGKKWGWGLSAIQFLTESDCLVHTDARSRTVYAELFSCRDFDAALGKELQRILKPEWAWARTIERALEG